MKRAGSENDLRVLVLAPTAKDAHISAGLLRGAGIETLTCTNLEQLVDAAAEGVARILSQSSAPPSTPAGLCSKASATT